MYVCELDRPWLDTPFLMQGFVIEDVDDARVVAEYCEHVWVDTDYEVPASQDSSNVGTLNQSVSDIFEHETPVEAEHKQVQSRFHKARSFTRDFLEGVRDGRAVDAEQAADTVEQCVDSIMRNPDALLWMVKIRQESEYTAEHSLNVCILAVAFGRQLGLSKAQLETLGLCGLLHDIGKMRVPPEILNKSDPLSTKEMNMMKAHTVHGRNLLLSTPSVCDTVVDAAYSHHERIDGLGYPRKLSGENISRYARIISIVDAYDAMTAKRCYSPAISTTDALKIIYEERGKQFDEALALAFIRTIGLFPVGSVVELANKEVGVVVENNPRFRHLPRVLLLLDGRQAKREPPKVIDLIHINEGDLERDYLIKRVLPDGSFGVYVADVQRRGLLLKY